MIEKIIIDVMKEEIIELDKKLKQKEKKLTEIEDFVMIEILDVSSTIESQGEYISVKNTPLKDNVERLIGQLSLLRKIKNILEA